MSVSLSISNMTCSFGSQDSLCGSYANNSTIIPLMKCEEDASSHLITLGVSSKHGQVMSERDLTLNRAGLFGLQSNNIALITICPKHRRKFTNDWPGRKSTTCRHPFHRGLRKQMKTVRRVNVSMSAELYLFISFCSGWL